MPTVTSITKQPTIALTPAYRPLEYGVLVSGDLTDYPAAIEIELVINGVVFGNRIPIQSFAFDNSGPAAISNFSFSISERVQRFFDMKDIWPDIGDPAPLVSSFFVASVYLNIYTLYPDPTTNLLEDAGTLVMSQTVPVINAYRRGDETASLALYDVQQINPALASFLTRQPNRVMVSLDDSAWLAAYIPALYSYRINAYDYTGALQATGQLATGQTLFGTPEVSILPVGPAQINAVDPADWLPNTGPVTINENTRVYVVQAGWYCPDGNFYSLTTIRRYYLVPSSCRKYRVHFINSFGVIDSFSVYNADELNYEIESEKYTKALPPGFGVIDEESTRIQANGQIQIAMDIGNITDEEARWLAREFGMTVMARIEEDGQYIPIVINDGSFPIRNSEDPLNIITFRVQYSQKESSQRR